MKTIWINPDKWADEMYHKKCVCGHELYKHAFTMGKYNDDLVELHVSQCVFCNYDKENDKFLCERFVRT